MKSIAFVKTLAAKALDNTLANTEAVFDAARAIARAKERGGAAAGEVLPSPVCQGR